MASSDFPELGSPEPAHYLLKTQAVAKSHLSSKKSWIGLLHGGKPGICAPARRNQTTAIHAMLHRQARGNP
jgi:hypothetical protein